MCSPETLPLTMEPESGFYCDPVIVLDFQSLYPSIIIAYNYCFTTCLGKISNIENICSANRIIEFGGLKYNCPVRSYCFISISYYVHNYLLIRLTKVTFLILILLLPFVYYIRFSLSSLLSIRFICSTKLFIFCFFSVTSFFSVS